MSIYPQKISEHFFAPKNCGFTCPLDGLGTIGSTVCGAVVRISLVVEHESSVITDARFLAVGCGYLIAAASHLTESIQGLRLGEAAGLNASAIGDVLGTAPDSKSHCYGVALEALVAAAIDYRSRRLEEWTEDDCLVCTCFGIAESTITEEIRANALSTVEDVGQAINAGRGCGSCRPLIQEIIDTVEA